MGKKKADDAQTKKRKRSSATSFRLAGEFGEESTSVNHRASRRTTIKKNARGRRGHRTEDILVIANESKEFPDEGVPDPPLDLPLPDGLDLEQLNNDFETFVPPESPKPKRKRQNTTSVRVFSSSFILICSN